MNAARLHVQVPIEQLAKDAVTLKELLKDYKLGSAVYGSSFGGVSATEASQYVPIASAGGIDGLTVHNYPYARHCNVSRCVDGPSLQSLLWRPVRVHMPRQSTLDDVGVPVACCCAGTATWRSSPSLKRCTTACAQ